MGGNDWPPVRKTSLDLVVAVHYSAELAYSSTRVGQKTDHFIKCITPVYDDIQYIKMYGYFVGSKTGILNIAIFK